MKFKFLSPQIICIVLGGLVLIWLVMQVAVFSSCWDTQIENSKNIQALCQTDQNLFFVRLLNFTKHNPQCSELMKEFEKFYKTIKPTIYIITPTYARPVQKAELTRLSHTLSLVPKLHWIVVEDSENQTSLVTNFLKKLKFTHTHLNIPTPLPYQMKKEDPSWLKAKGVMQRNIALNYLRRHTSLEERAVVYFADDDNTYDLELFEEMRYTKMVSVWPVGLVGGLMVEKPLVKDGKVVGWNTVWKANRPFPIDMAGFAVNLTLLLKHPEAGFSLAIPRGYQESNLLKSLVRIDQLEPKANNCSKVLVWHTRTEYPKLKQEYKLAKPSNLNIEV